MKKIIAMLQEISLYEGLRQFGLNPAEWRVSQVALDTYRVEHVCDSISFIGKISEISVASVQWRELELETV